MGGGTRLGIPYTVPLLLPHSKKRSVLSAVRSEESAPRRAVGCGFRGPSRNNQSSGRQCPTVPRMRRRRLHLLCAGSVGTGGCRERRRRRLNTTCELPAPRQEGHPLPVCTPPALVLLALNMTSPGAAHGCTQPCAAHTRRTSRLPCRRRAHCHRYYLPQSGINTSSETVADTGGQWRSGVVCVVDSLTTGLQRENLWHATQVRWEGKAPGRPPPSSNSPLSTHSPRTPTLSKK